MKKIRKHYTSAEKVNILKLHLLEDKPVSDLCDKYQLQPAVFYRWQKEFFENGATAFERVQDHGDRVKDRRIAQLEEKLHNKDEVLAELMYEHVQLKKSLGEI
jgi:transposase-like protein